MGFVLLCSNLFTTLAYRFSPLGIASRFDMILV